MFDDTAGRWTAEDASTANEKFIQIFLKGGNNSTDSSN
jgi:hypothetical protein